MIACVLTLKCMCPHAKVSVCQHTQLGVLQLPDVLSLLLDELLQGRGATSDAASVPSSVVVPVLRKTIIPRPRGALHPHHLPVHAGRNLQVRMTHVMSLLTFVM